jgi:hypothetical protein
MDDSAQITLPHGLWIAGHRLSAVRMRPLDSDDDKFLLASTSNAPLRRANGLLSRCVLFPEQQPVPSIDALVIGDREALLLHLHRMTFGDEIQANFSCPSATCAETLELKLRVSELLVSPYSDTAPSYQREIGHGHVQYQVRFRLPTTGDQHEIAPLARLDADQAARQLLRRCVERVLVAGGEIEVSSLPEPVIDEIAALMAELDAQAVIEFTLTCPGCGFRHQVQFDAADFLLRELDQRVDRTIREVHTLALFYHWSEEAILNLPSDRRQKYLDLIAAGSEIVS